MRLQFLIALIVATLISGWYYYDTALPCVVPLSYHVGSIDARFNLATSSVEQVIADAITVWETAVGRDLFFSDADADLSVDFIYDDRQAQSDRAEQQKNNLSEKEAESKEINEQYTALLREYDTAKKDYDADARAYQKRLDTFNETVNRYNEAGGAPADVFADLEREEAALKREENTLEATARNLSAIAQKINTLSERGNAVISEYNQGVESFNEKFTGGEQFTQGDYTGDAIHIYHFKDTNELRNVLVHEFGHVLGLPHVEGGESIMYYLMDKQPATSALSENDLAALTQMCLPNDSWQTRLHQVFSSIFIRLNLL